MKISNSVIPSEASYDFIFSNIKMNFRAKNQHSEPSSGIPQFHEKKVTFLKKSGKYKSFARLLLYSTTISREKMRKKYFVQKT